MAPAPLTLLSWRYAGNQLREMDQVIKDLQDFHPELEVFDPRSVFCDAEYCYSGAPGENWYRDRDHLTPTGSIKLVDQALRGFD